MLQGKSERAIPLALLCLDQNKYDYQNKYGSLLYT